MNANEEALLDKYSEDQQRLLVREFTAILDEVQKIEAPISKIRKRLLALASRKFFLADGRATVVKDALGVTEGITEALLQIEKDFSFFLRPRSAGQGHSEQLKAQIAHAADHYFREDVGRRSATGRPSAEHFNEFFNSYLISRGAKDVGLYGRVVSRKLSDIYYRQAKKDLSKK
jgi:hypothetical protein